MQVAVAKEPWLGWIGQQLRGEACLSVWGFEKLSLLTTVLACPD